MAERSKSSGKSKSTAARAGGKKAAKKKSSTRKKTAGTKKKTTGTATGGGAKARSTKSRKKAPAKKTAAASASAGAATDTAAMDPAAQLGLVEPEERKLPPVKIAKRDLTAIEKALLMIRTQLTQDVSALTQNNLSHSGRDMSGDLSGYGFHMADVATDNFAREMELNIATGETDRLRLVEEALDRVQDGTFGRCLECGDPVGVPRLKVIPYARLCIRCAEEAERA